MDDTQAKHLMAWIVDKNPGKAIAFMEVANEGETKVHYVAYQRTNQLPYSHITLLYQALLTNFSRTKACAQRLYTSIAATEMCRGMAQVLDAYAPVLATGGDIALVEGWSLIKHDPAPYIAIAPLEKFKLAKAITSPALDLTKEGKTIDHTGYHTVHRVYMMLAYALLTKRDTLTVDAGHNIGVLLVSKEGQILSWGLNTNAVNATRHGEVNAIQSYFKYNTGATSLPKGARLYTTLKPCKMCAGMIYETALEKDIRVYWGQDDSGKPAQNTALDKYEKSHHVVLQRLLNKNDAISEPKPIRLYDSAVKQPENMANQLEAGKGSTAVTTYLAQTTATGLMDSAVLTLRRKMVRSEITTKTKTEGKVVNPNVKKALAHIYTFMVDQGLSAVLT